MSKPVKEMILADYRRRFSDVANALIVDIRGVDANTNNALRLGLQKKGIQVTVVKNTLVRKAVSGTNLAALAPGFDGPSALVYGADSVVEMARELVDWARTVEALDLKGAVLDGQYFEGAEGVVRLSRYPTRVEAQGEVVQLVLSPAAELVGAVAGPGGQVLAIVESIIERLQER